MSAIMVTIYITDILGLCLGIWLIWWRSPTPHSMTRDLVVWVFLGLLLAFATFFVGIAGFLGWGRFFGVLRLWCHVIFCILIPLMMARAWLYRRGHPRLVCALLLAGLFMEGIYLYARRVEPYRLEVVRHEIRSPKLATLMSPVKIALVADLQTDTFGDYERRVFQTIKEEDPDLVLLAGDYIQAPQELRPRLRRELAALFETLDPAPPLGIIAVQGDVDFAEEALAQTASIVLADETYGVPDEPLQIIGLSQASTRMSLPPSMLQQIEEFEGFSIVIGHAPDYMNRYLSQGSSLEALLIAGHTHGGQIVIPGLGPPITLSRAPRRIAKGGYSQHGMTHVVVSRGIGMERGTAPRIRLFCPPELTIITLRAP